MGLLGMDFRRVCFGKEHALLSIRSLKKLLSIQDDLRPVPAVIEPPGAYLKPLQKRGIVNFWGYSLNEKGAH